MTREEAINILDNHKDWFLRRINDEEAEAYQMAIKSLEAWDKVIKFISGRINHWDAPCSGDETVRNELASVMWEIARKMKEVEDGLH